MHTLGKRAWGNPPRVRISHPPQSGLVIDAASRSLERDPDPEILTLGLLTRTSLRNCTHLLRYRSEYQTNACQFTMEKVAKVLGMSVEQLLK